MRQGYNRKHLKFVRTPRTKKIGCAYIITHPLYEGWSKIGHTKNVRIRWKSYNIYDPLKRFILYFHLSSDFCDELESMALDIFRSMGFRQSGEWVSCSPELAKNILESINTFLANSENESLDYTQKFDMVRGYVSKQMGNPTPKTFSEISQSEKQLRIEKRIKKEQRKRKHALMMWKQWNSGPVQISTKV